jgi:hypothetical protein
METKPETFDQAAAYEHFSKLAVKERELIPKIVSDLQLSELKWRTIDPGSQFTGSFNPIMEDPKMWYLDYYKS